MTHVANFIVLISIARGELLGLRDSLTKNKRIVSIKALISLPSSLSRKRYFSALVLIDFAIVITFRQSAELAYYLSCSTKNKCTARLAPFHGWQGDKHDRHTE
jgi:hypothetical protein